MGICNYKQKNYHSAILNLSKVLALFPYHAEALYHRGLVLYKLKDFENSLADANSSISYNTPSSWPKILRAKIYLKNEEYQKAESEAVNFSECQAIKSFRVQLKICTRKQKLSDAMNESPEALDLDKRIHFFYLRSQIYTFLNQIEERNEDLEQMLKLDPQNPYALKMNEHLKDKNEPGSKENILS